MFQFHFPFLALGFAVSLVNTYSDPGPCKGACWAHDPTIIQRASDSKYFKFNTGTGIEIATASSLSGPWTLEGYVLPNGSSIDNAGRKDPWAPDVHLVGDEYFLYYAVSTFGSQVSAIGLAVSESMEPGSWSDRGSVGVASKRGGAYNASELTYPD
jgi:arabinan endo-1,5-alpha-L-arabinosidase